MGHCDMMVNTYWSTPDLLTDSMKLERNGVCLVRASVIVTMNGEPSEIWRLDRRVVCLGKKGSVCKCGKCVEYCAGMCMRVCFCVTYIVYLRACAPVGSRMCEDVKRQLIGCQSQVLHLSWRCCW